MSWYNLQVKKDDRTVFRASAKTWRGLIEKIAKKHWGGFEEMVAHIFREDWVYLMTGKKIGGLNAEELEEISDKTQTMAKKNKRTKKVTNKEYKVDAKTLLELNNLILSIFLLFLYLTYLLGGTPLTLGLGVWISAVLAASIILHVIIAWTHD